MQEDDETMANRLFQILHVRGYISLCANLWPRDVVKKGPLWCNRSRQIPMPSLSLWWWSYIFSWCFVQMSDVQLPTLCTHFLLAATIYGIPLHCTYLFLIQLHLFPLHWLLLFLLLLFLSLFILPLLLQVVLLILLFLNFSSSSSSSCSSEPEQTGWLGKQGLPKLVWSIIGALIMINVHTSDIVTSMVQKGEKNKNAHVQWT